MIPIAALSAIRNAPAHWPRLRKGVWQPLHFWLMTLMTAHTSISVLQHDAKHRNQLWQEGESWGHLHTTAKPILTAQQCQKRCSSCTELASAKFHSETVHLAQQTEDAVSPRGDEFFTSSLASSDKPLTSLSRFTQLMAGQNKRPAPEWWRDARTAGSPSQRISSQIPSAVTNFWHRQLSKSHRLGNKIATAPMPAPLLLPHGSGNQN